MKSQSAINDRILREIDNLKADDKIKNFLKEILLVELDIMDKDRGQYVDQYKAIIDRII
jgi:hypothetical protein